MAIRKNTITTATGTHSGHKTHHHDHAIKFVSFRAIKIRQRMVRNGNDTVTELDCAMWALLCC